MSTAISSINNTALDILMINYSGINMKQFPVVLVASSNATTQQLSVDYDDLLS